MQKQTQDKLLKIVHDNYREIAAQFDVTRKKHIWPELENILANLSANSSILDVGCGNGRLLEALKDKNIKYLGVDNGEELIELAKKNYPNNNFSVVDIFYFLYLNTIFVYSLSNLLHYLIKFFGDENYFRCFYPYIWVKF